MTTYEIALIVLPVFGLIGLGYLSALTGYLSEQVGDAVGKFVYSVAIPLLLFRTLGTAKFPDVSPWALYFAYFTGVAVVWIFADLVVRLVFGRDARAGIIAGVSASYSNLVLIGIPLTLTAFGEEGLVPLLLIIAVHLPVMTAITTILIARADGGEGKTAGTLAKKVVVTLASNPIIIGLLAGVVWRLTGLGIMEVPLAVMDKVGAAAVPCALFSMGMALKKYGIRGNIGPGLVISLLKLGLFPLVVWLIAEHVVHLPPIWTIVAVIAAATPTGVNVYLLANQFGTGHGISANSITVTTSAAVITIGLWLRFMGAG